MCLPQSPTQSNTAVVHNHRESLIACQPCYLLEWSAPPSLSPSSPVCILLSCLVAVLVLSCASLPLLLLLPAGSPFNDTQDHRPSHPHLRPLRLCRPQLRESTLHPRYQIVLTTASLAGSDNALPIQSTYLIPTLALSTALRLVSLSGARLQPSPRAVQPVSSLIPSGVGGAWTVLIYSLSTLRITSAAHIRAAYRSHGHCDGCPAAGT